MTKHQRTPQRHSQSQHSLMHNSSTHIPDDFIYVHQLTRYILTYDQLDLKHLLGSFDYHVKMTRTHTDNMPAHAVMMKYNRTKTDTDRGRESTSFIGKQTSTRSSHLCTSSQSSLGINFCAYCFGRAHLQIRTPTIPFC